jgi:hypothetical protein
MQLCHCAAAEPTSILVLDQYVQIHFILLNRGAIINTCEEESTRKRRISTLEGRDRDYLLPIIICLHGWQCDC